MADVEATPNLDTSTDASAVEGPGKGLAFFERARTVAESGNFDYAIEMYIAGLNREPENTAEHQALAEVAVRRKIQGTGSRSRFGARGFFKGKTPKEQMLNAEYQLAKDWGNIPAFMAFIRAASAAGYADVIRWIGPVIANANYTNKNPKKEIYLELADIYEKIGEFDRTLEGLNAAFRMAPNDMSLPPRINAMAAKATLKKGQYEKEEGFRDSLRDADATRDLIQQDSMLQNDDYRIRQAKEAKVAYDANPHDHQAISKYASALAATEEEDYELEAMKVLQKAFEETKTYRYKSTRGDIKMRQMARNVRMLRDAVKDYPDDESLKADLVKLEREQLSFEISEFKERAEHFPTDLQVLFDYGSRLYRAGRLDEAMPVLQSAQGHPKYRVDALYMLGRCFMQQNMEPEAVETFKRALEDYELANQNDPKSKEVHYWLARACEATGEEEEAMRLFSKITQWDIGFRDARQRLVELRKKKKAQ